MPPHAAQRALPVTIVVLVVLALFVPARFQTWAGWVHDLLDIGVAPVSRPLVLLGAWLRGGSTPPDDDALRVLDEQLELTKSELLRQRQENARLQQIIADLQSGIRLSPDAPVRVVQAGVFAYGTDPRTPFMRVQAGRRQGLHAGSFTLAPGLQLVGRVVDVTERTCTVRPFTARGAEALAAVIILAEGSPDGLRCTLAPVGDGSLRGPVEDRRDPATNAAVEPVPGQVVRLDDPTWPKAARMLLLGRVERVEPSPGQPLRKVVIVRPTIARLEHLSDLIIWTPEFEGSDDAAARGGGTP